jgi:sugar fermentation stimulation protein A
MRLDLQPATFLRRYKRFLADVRLPDGSVVVAHCPNSGSMRTLHTPEVACWLARHDSPTRRLPWTLTLLQVGTGGWAAVDTHLPNGVVAEGVAAGLVPELAGYATLRREVAYGEEGSRIDLLLEDPGRPPCWVEVKSVTQAGDEDGWASFPDAVTARGAKHLRELARLARGGARAVQFYLVGRTDRRHASVATDIDPDYAAGLAEAVAAGVEVVCYRAAISPRAFTVGEPCPFLVPSSAIRSLRRPRRRGGAAP